MKNKCYIHEIIHDQIDFIIEVLNENWSLLKDEIYE